MDWLNERNVEIPATATIKHLRALYENHPENMADHDEDEEEDQEDDNEEEIMLNAEIRILQKRKQIADLRRELAANDALVGRPPDFHDVKCLVPLFAGGDSYIPERWLEDFERACDSVRGDAEFRLKCIRRLMEPGSEAEWFLRVDRSSTYNEFRRNFLENFGHSFTVAEIIDKLRKTTFSSCNTTVMGYILKMQEIALRANIDEAQIVQIIVDGFHDRSADISVLYPAKDMTQLKQLARRYAQLREARSTPVRATPSSSVSSKSKAKIDPDSTLRCYNCSGKGHISARCPEPRREPGSCFRCGSHQHIIKDCPKPAPRRKDQVALVEDFRQGNHLNTATERSSEQLSGALSEINLVSVAFLSEGKVHPAGL